MSISQSDKQKFIDMIGKLSQMTSKDSGAFQGEISNASAKISLLMDKYSITWADIHADQAAKQSKEYEDAFTSKPSDYVHKKVQKWHWMLARIISHFTHTRNYLGGSERMTFFGTEENAKIAATLFTLWITNINSMADNSLKSHKKAMLKEFGDHKNFWSSLPEDLQPRYYRTSWVLGCLDAMRKNVDEQEKVRTVETTNAIALYKAEIDKYYQIFAKENLKSIHVKSSVKNFSDVGYNAGHTTGSGIKLDSKPIGTGRKLLSG
jgi:hypothetical protein